VKRLRIVAGAKMYAEMRRCGWPRPEALLVAVVTARSVPGGDGVSTCRTCGRELVDHRVAENGHPGTDCGGDCLACMEDFERDFPDDVRARVGAKWRDAA